MRGVYEESGDCRALRTPLGSFNGSLAGIGATKLGAVVIEEAVQRLKTFLPNFRTKTTNGLHL